LTVQVLAQGPLPAKPLEAQALGLTRRQAVHGRSVLLRGAGQAMVLAHTVVAPGAARGAWRAVRGLGQRPLAELLFTRLDVQRAARAYVWLPRHSPQARHWQRLWSQACGGEPLPAGGLWQRGSVFTRQGQTLLVSEVFAPALVRGWPTRSRQSAGKYSRSE
jgi:chorismate--pyruvate lyase